MSRIRMNRKSETSAFAWFMACDRCSHRDATPYPGRSNQPPLYRFLLLGWAIGDSSDRCPNCVASGPAPSQWQPYFTAGRMGDMRAAAESGEDPRGLLRDLTDAEVATLRAGVMAP